jgi:hypothetical protein
MDHQQPQKRRRACRIELEALSLAEQRINQHRRAWELRFDRLGDYLNSLNIEGDGDGE